MEKLAIQNVATAIKKKKKKKSKTQLLKRIKKTYGSK